MNNTALVTGASKRIGKALSEYLAQKGWDIILHFNYSGNEASQLATHLQKKYPSQNFNLIQADLSQTREVLNLVPNTIAKFGRFDLLINNASLFNPGHIKNTGEELFDSQINVNLKAPFFLIRDFAIHCRQGSIINFVDTRVTSNKTNFAAYSLSKKMLWELTKMAALEFAPEIRVNAIAPGVTLPPEDEDDTYLLNLAKNIPMRKPGGVEPIFKSIDYIIENDHLTGQLLFADGGENLGKNE